jgi:hypothetical protein
MPKATDPISKAIATYRKRQDAIQVRREKALATAADKVDKKYDAMNAEIVAALAKLEA